jgi:hypothetical protein
MTSVILVHPRAIEVHHASSSKAGMQAPNRCQACISHSTPRNFCAYQQGLLLAYGIEMITTCIEAWIEAVRQSCRNPCPISDSSRGHFRVGLTNQTYDVVGSEMGSHGRNDADGSDGYRPGISLRGEWSQGAPASQNPPDGS